MVQAPTSSPLQNGIQNDGLWRPNRQDSPKKLSSQAPSSPYRGPKANLKFDRDVTEPFGAGATVQAPLKALSPINHISSQIQIETEYLNADQKRLNSRQKAQQTSLIKQQQSGSLESISNEEMRSAHIVHMYSKKSKSQVRSTIMTNGKQERFNDDLRAEGGQSEINMMHISKTPKSNKNAKPIYLGTKSGNMTGPPNPKVRTNDMRVPSDFSRFDSQFDKMNRINSRLRGQHQNQNNQDDLRAHRHDSANMAVFFKNRKSNFEPQQKLIPVSKDDPTIQSSWQNQNQPVDGLEPIPSASSSKMYQMKSSFRNYQQSKMLGQEIGYQVEDGRSLKAQSQIQQQQRPYQYKDNTYSTSALKRDLHHKLENIPHQKSHIIQQQSLANLKSVTDNQNHMKFIHDFQDSIQKGDISDSTHDYQLMFDNTNIHASKAKIQLQKLPNKASILPEVDQLEMAEKYNRQFIPNQNSSLGNKQLATQHAIVQQQLSQHNHLLNSNSKRKSKNFFKLDQNQHLQESSIPQPSQMANHLYTNTYTQGAQNHSPSLQPSINKKINTANPSEKSKTHSETLHQGIDSQLRQQEMMQNSNKKKTTFSIHKQNVNAKQQFREFNNQKKSLSYTNGGQSIAQGIENGDSLGTDASARANGPFNLSKLLLTPWSERQQFGEIGVKNENSETKEVNRITKIGQMSSNGLKLNSGLQSRPHANMWDKNQHSNRQTQDDNFKRQHATIHNMILNIISGSSGDQVKKNLSNSKSLLSKNIAHMGMLSGLNEHQLRLLIQNYYLSGNEKQPLDINLMQQALTINNQGQPMPYNLAQQMVNTPESLMNDHRVNAQSSEKNKRDTVFLNQNDLKNVSKSGGDMSGDQNHFYVGLKYQGGQMVTNLNSLKTKDEKVVDRSPSVSKDTGQLPLGADRNILSTRAPKLINKVNKNINIIGEDQSQCNTPYEGMFSLSSSQPPDLNSKYRLQKDADPKSPVAQKSQSIGAVNGHIQKEHKQFVDDILKQKQSQEFDSLEEKEVIKDIVKSMINTNSQTTEVKNTQNSKQVQQKSLQNSSMPTSQTHMKQMSSLQPNGTSSNKQVISNHQKQKAELCDSNGFTSTLGKDINQNQTPKENRQEQWQPHKSQITSTAQSTSQSNQQPQNTKPKSPAQQKQEPRGPDPTKSQKPDFNLEYAQLIAKQFPIHDDKGNLIDYSNINEFQLELLALHEEYGEEKSEAKKKMIFQKLSHMNQEEYFRCKRLGIPYMKNFDVNFSDKKVSKTGLPLRSNGMPFGRHVGKDGGNPDYRKNVIQLEKERLEREKQELIMKRKRNSNYIQQCIRHGNEHYSGERLNSLAWLKKDKPNDDDADTHQSIIANKLDEKNIEILRKKQEIMATYNEMSKKNKPNFADDGMYRYSYVKGNNSAMVMNVLKSRDYWVELEEKHLTLYSFKWSPTSKYINYDQLGAHGQRKLVNHIQGHDQLTTKDLLYKNMFKLLEANKVNVFQYLPIQFVLDLSAKNFISEVDKFCKYYNCIEKVKNKNKQYNESQVKEINNNIQNSKIQSSDTKYKNVVSRRYTIDDQMYQGGNVWLIKPNDFNRGRGVRLFNTLEQLRGLMKEFSLGNEMDFYMHNACCQILANEKAQNTTQKQQQEEPKEVMSPTGKQKEQESNKEDNKAPNLSANVKSEVFVIQKYIEKPLLIDERKFDIRLWVLCDQTDLSNQRCFLFREGYIRTSSHKFTLSQESIDQPFIHLTNNAVQQFDSNYGKLEEGNQLSFNAASAILKEQNGLDIDFYQILANDIVPIIEMSFKSVEGKLNPNCKKHSFEIYGYDFMIDEMLRPWLIEVNTNPCLEETSKILRQYLPRMIDDAFKLTLDILYPPLGRAQQSTKQSSEGEDGQPSEYPSISVEGKKKPYPVDGYKDHENLWQHFYTLKSQ